MDRAPAARTRCAAPTSEDYASSWGTCRTSASIRISYLDVNPAQYTNLQASLERTHHPEPLRVLRASSATSSNDGWLYGARNVQIDGTPGDSSLVSDERVRQAERPGHAQAARQQQRQPLADQPGLHLSRRRPGQRYLGFRQNPDGIPRFEDIGITTTLLMTHTLSNRAFYTLNASAFTKRFQSRAFDEPDDPRYNTFLLDTPSVVTYTDEATGNEEFVFVPTGPGRFLRGGVDLGRFERQTQNYSAKADFTWQALDEHLLKTGLEVRLDDIFLEGYSLTQDPTDSSQLVVPGEGTNAFQQIDGVRR